MTYNESEFAFDLDLVLGEVREMLITKNAAYGDSALNPVRIFSKSSADEQLLVRIDDKISRLSRGEAAGEDVIHDLLGYLVLYRIAQKRRWGEPMLTADEQKTVIEQSSASFASYAGPFVGKRVESPLEEKKGEVVVDDGDVVQVRWEDGEAASYSLKMFKSGIREKWLVWSEEEKQDGEQEKEE